MTRPWAARPEDPPLPRWLPALAAVALLVGIGLRLLFVAAHSAMEGDEYTYARMARDLVGRPPGGEPLVEPALWPLLWAASHGLFPIDWETLGRSLAVLCSVGLLLALPPASRAIFGGPGAGLGALVCLAAYAPLVDLGSRPLTEPLYHLLVLLSLWQGWRALRATAEASPEGLRESLLAGLALGLAAAARREGQLALGLFPLILAAAGCRSLGPRRALAAAALCLGGSLLVLLPLRLITERGRPVPRAARDAASLGRLGWTLLLPILAPAGLLLLSPRRPLDGLRALLFAPFLAVAPLAILFPDPGRKAVALVPLAALAAGEGVRRLLDRAPQAPSPESRPGRLQPEAAARPAHRGHGNGGRIQVQALVGPALCLGLTAWFFAQGLSKPLMPHLVPPWTDRAEDRAAGRWILDRAGPGQAVACADGAAAWYAGGRWRAVRSPRSGEDLVERCRGGGTEWLVVDRRSPDRGDPVLGPLGAWPGDRPGLVLEAVLPLEVSPLGRLLSSPLRSKGVYPDSRAVVYRVSPCP